MLGMCGISFLVVFIQVHIIAAFPHKINTFFKKIFCLPKNFHPPNRCLSTPHIFPQFPHRRMCRLLCQGGNFCTKIHNLVIITTCEKIRIRSLPVKQLYVNQITDIHNVDSCGKLLWKTVWTMWKTLSFQQVFRFFPESPSHVENSLSPPPAHPSLHRLLSCYVTARCHFLTVKLLRNSWVSR